MKRKEPSNKPNNLNTQDPKLNNSAVVPQKRIPIQRQFLLIVGIFLLIGLAAVAGVLVEGQRTFNPSTSPESSNPGATASATIAPSTPPQESPIPKSSKLPAASASPNPTSSPSTNATLTLKLTVDGHPSLGTVQLIYPSNNVLYYQIDSGGSKTLTDQPPGNYRAIFTYGVNKAIKDFSLVSEQQLTVEASLSSAQPTPSPTPDTTPPVLDTVNGPYDWGEQGICFTINGNQVHDNISGQTFAFNWKMDSNDWSGFSDNQSTKCYTGLNSGSHVLSAKVRDASGNESNQINLSFTK